MINIDVLKGFQPRFRNFDIVPGEGGYDCNSITIPTVDSSSVECLEFTPTNCIKTSKSYNFFGIGTLETLTSALDKIMLKVKAINEKFRTTIDYSSLESFADDTAAGVGGIEAGKPYVDTLGYLRIKL